MAGAACTIAFAEVIPGSGARTKVSGVCNRWSRWWLLRVCPGTGIRSFHQTAAGVCGNRVVLVNHFAAPNGSSNHAAQRATHIGRDSMALVQHFLRHHLYRAGIDQGQVGVESFFDPALVWDAETPRPKVRGELADFS